MAAVHQLEELVNDISRAAENYAQHLKLSNAAFQDTSSCTNNAPFSFSPTPGSDVPNNDVNEGQETRRTLLAKTAQLRSLFLKPVDLLQDLAFQTQFLACLNWLMKCQILACIPSTGIVSMKDVALLSAVSDTQLAHIVRIVSSAGFLCEPSEGMVAHTLVSARFGSSFQDAAIFLTEDALPAALRMVPQVPRMQNSTEVPIYTDAGTMGGTEAPNYDPKRGRRATAFLRHVIGEDCLLDASFTEVLSRLDWSNLGHACVVDATARSMKLSTELSELYPKLRLVVQFGEWKRTGSEKHLGFPTKTLRTSINSFSEVFETDSTQITVQTRTFGTPQVVRDGAVYILSVPNMASILTHASKAHSESLWITAELKAHLEILSSNPHTTLILTMRWTRHKESGSRSQVNTAVSIRELLVLQMTGAQSLDLSELLILVPTISDGTGRLTVVNSLKAKDGTIRAVCIKYQPHPHQQHTRSG